MTEESLFLAALDRANAAERRKFLDDACAGQPEVRQRIERLLVAFAAGKDKLEPAAADPDATSHFTPRSFDAGTTLVGRYKLLERIGEGGMGEVWMAEQVKPVQRRVAVKLIKPGMDTKAVLARFEAERQALALMDHPNIARVFDGGTTHGEPGGVSPGRPFFVMELVKGVPITEYCDARKLGPRERLELFIPVAQAVQHAHQKGVIHRDLKPSNVLVAPFDGRPVPKVIDFGIAKAAGARLTDLTLHTAFGAVIGTPQYMAPEQAELNNLDVDTRADVYSLGVLLYELLAGSPPFEARALAEAGLLEAFRVIREQEPPKPSTKASTSAALPTIAANRGLEPKKLTGLLRGEIDWIVMKALEKDRGRRYETANGFAADVQRYLAGEQVLAVPPSAGYRVRKFVRRNKARVTVAAVLFTLLIGGIIGTTIGMVRADRARRDEADQRMAAERLQVEADAERMKAEYQAASVAVDLDLKFFDGQESATGMLRLARRLKLLPADAVELRQFVMMSLFARGQEIARLAPGSRYPAAKLSPDGRTLIQHDVASGGVLTDLLTGRELARVWPKETAAWQYEFSADGRALVKFDYTTLGVWDSPSGRRRCEIRPGTGNIDKVIIGPGADRLVIFWDPDPLPQGGPNARTVIQLWDGASGRLIARLDHAGKAGEHCVFSPDGSRFLTAAGPVARAWSSIDGRLLQTLAGHTAPVEALAFSPSGARAATCECDRLHWWTAADWRPAAVPCQLRFDQQSQEGSAIKFLHEDVLSVTRFVREGRDSTPYYNLTVFGEALAHDLNGQHSDGVRVLTGDERMYALRPLRRLDLPAGRRYPDEFRALAVDGRFLVSHELWASDRLVDLAAEKAFPFMSPALQACPAAGCAFSGYREPWPIVLPAPDLTFDADTLNLWAQVLVRGELDSVTGFFVKHDEATWEQNRQELLRRPKPAGEFPFPGSFTADSLHWLRQELGPNMQSPRRALFDRLVAAEPTYENYSARAGYLIGIGDYPGAIRDAEVLRAITKRTGEGHDTSIGFRAVSEIVFRPNLPAAHYEQARAWLAAGCQLGDCVNERGAALLRLGRYAEALATLREPEALLAAQVAAAFMAPTYALGVVKLEPDEVRTLLIGYCEFKLGRPAAAKAALARARSENERHVFREGWHVQGEYMSNFANEAEAAIEGKK